MWPGSVRRQHRACIPAARHERMKTLLAGVIGMGLVGSVMAKTSVLGVRLVFQAIGTQAPQRESFDVLPQKVCWRDDQNQVRMVYDRASGVLRLQSHAGADTGERLNWVQLDVEGVQALAAQRREASEALDHQTRRGTPAEQALGRRRMGELFAPRGPWAALDTVTAEDPMPSLPGVQHVLGYGCSRITLHARGQQVGEACVVAPQTVAGGTAVVQMLSAMAAVLDQLRMQGHTIEFLGLPSHPLLPAARGGQLPLKVVQMAPEGNFSGLQLQAVQHIHASACSD